MILTKNRGQEDKQICVSGGQTNIKEHREGVADIDVSFLYLNTF
jgi:hypothetical protein